MPTLTTKLYTIRITGALDNPNIWYANKVGNTYEAIKYRFNCEPVFRVALSMHVHLKDCEILKVKTIDKYVR